MTRPSKVLIKAKSGNLEFSLILSKVLDGADLPATSANNTLQVDLLINGAFTTQNLLFNLVDGKIDPSAKRFPVANGSLPGAPTAGDPVDVVGVRVRESGTGFIFGVAGVTLK